MNSKMSKIIVVLACTLFILLALFTSTYINENNKKSNNESSAEASEICSEQELSSQAVSQPEEPYSNTPSDEPSEEMPSEIEPSEAEPSETEPSETEPSESEPSEESSEPVILEKEKPEYVEKQNNKKYIAFTFDGAPNALMPGVLDFIEESGITATFFTVGEYLENNALYGSYIERAASLGCEIGIQSYTDGVYYNKCTDDEFASELERAAAVTAPYAGYYPIIMRPLDGYITAERAEKSGYNVIIWWVDTDIATDADTDEVSSAAAKIVSDVKNSASAIIRIRLDSDASVEAFKLASAALAEDGYSFLTVAQLCDLDADTTIGKRYWSPTYVK